MPADLVWYHPEEGVLTRRNIRCSPCYARRPSSCSGGVRSSLTSACWLPSGRGFLGGRKPEEAAASSGWKTMAPFNGMLPLPSRSHPAGAREAGRQLDDSGCHGHGPAPVSSQRRYAAVVAPSRNSPRSASSRQARSSTAYSAGGPSGPAAAFLSMDMAGAYLRSRRCHETGERDAPVGEEWRETASCSLFKVDVEGSNPFSRMGVRAISPPTMTTRCPVVRGRSMSERVVGGPPLEASSIGASRPSPALTGDLLAACSRGLTRGRGPCSVVDA
jgi:hypothetical protein